MTHISMNKQQSMTEIHQLASWGEELRAYTANRTQLPWASDHPDYQPPKRVTHAEVKAQQRRFDPIAMAYRNPEVEQVAVRQHQLIQDQRQQRSKRPIRNWSLIAHDNHDDDTHTAPRSNTSVRPNIISHLPSHSTISLFYDEE